MTRGTERPATAATPSRSVTSADDVLDAAEALLASGGFDQLSVRSIATRLAVSRQVVYTHFGGMGGLLDGLHRRLSSRLIAAVDAAAGDDAPVGRGTTEHILRAAAAYRSVARRWPELYQLVFEQPVPDHAVGDAALAEGRAAFGRIVELADAWLACSRGTPPTNRDATELARAVWSATHGFVVLERVGFASVDETDALANRATVSMLAGW
ncbi:MAG: TetR/AcrR family transcriptional regulator [Ilumatobacter sp.]